MATAELQNTKKLKSKMSNVVMMRMTMIAGTSFLERGMDDDWMVGKAPTRRPRRGRVDILNLMLQEFICLVIYV